MSTEVNRPTDLQLIEQGRREGYALAGLVLSLVSFINLLGAEKSILAIVLATFALRGAASAAARKNARIAVAVAAVHVVTILIVVVLFRDKFAQLLKLLRQLG
jgi:hypothetical protein